MDERRSRSEGREAPDVPQGPTAGATSGRDLASFVFRQLPVIALVWLGVSAATATLVYVLPPSYTASSLLLVERSEDPTLRSNPASYTTESVEVMATETQIVTSRAVAEAVVDRLDLESRPVKPSILDAIRAPLADLGLVSEVPRRDSLVRNIQQGTKVSALTPASVIQIQYAHERPERAMETVRAITEAYLEVRLSTYATGAAAFLEAQLQETAAKLDELLAAERRGASKPRTEALALERRALENAYLFYSKELDEARAEQATDVSLTNVRVVDHAALPSRPRISRLRLILIGSLAGLGLAIGLALLREYFDHTAHTPAELAERAGVPVLSSVRRVGGLRRRRALAGDPG